MKKLKTWQIVLLVIFWPAGIAYLVMRSKKPSGEIIKEMYSNVVGSNYTNNDGSSRQTYITHLKEGDDLFFKPAPTEEYPDSVGVFSRKGEQIGVVAYNALNELRGQYANNTASVSVHQIINSDSGLGVNMHIKIYK
jgi:hypothetical protein